MVTGKPIKPSGTAAERIAAQKQQAQAMPSAREQVATLPPHIAAEMDRMRSEAVRLQGSAPTAVEDLPAFDDEPLPEQPPLSPEEIFGEMAPMADFDPFGICTSVTIQLHDGREIEMGPPAVPHQLTIPKMMGERADLKTTAQADADIKLARVMSYIRRINNSNMPVLQKWDEVTKLARNLGDLGCRAVYECYGENWSDFTPTGWKQVKRSVSSRNSGTP